MSTLSPSVAVIIPCYNRESFIRETIDSALSQTYRNIETIVVDDGSTDNSRKILDSYKDRIRVLEHPGGVNRGQSATINLGLRSSKSEYVAILDSDDVWVPHKIERQVHFLERNPEFGLVYCNGSAIDGDGKILYPVYGSDHIEENRPERVLLDCYFNVPSNSLIRRSALDRAGYFDESMRSAQDHDMAIRLAEVTKVAYLEEILWFYRKHADTQSGKYAGRRWKTGFRILKKACERRHYGWNVRRRRLAVLNFRLGQCFVEERRLGPALARFALAGMLDPLRGIRVLLGFEPVTGPH